MLQLKYIENEKLINVFKSNVVDDNKLIGQIKYSPRWKKLVFIPEPNTIFDSQTLGELKVSLKHLSIAKKYKDHV